MENTLNTRNKIVRICSCVAVYLIALLFGVITVASIIQTSHIDPTNPMSEKILFDSDLILTNLALIVLTVMAALWALRKNIRLCNVDFRFIMCVMLLFSTILSLAWVNLVQSEPSGDSLTMLNTAKDAAQEKYTSFFGGHYGNKSFYAFYPEELGFVLFAEIFYRIFGTGSSALLFQILNVIAMDFTYVGLVLLSKRIFDRSSVTNLTAILLTLCLQPMFITTFTYSFLIGLAFIVWAIYFAVRFMQDNKLWHAGVGILLGILGYVIRPEYMVILIALSIALLLHTVDKLKVLAIVMAAFVIAGAVGVQALVINGYANRANAKLDTHLSLKLRHYAGVSESGMAPGWYNAVDVNTLLNANMDMDAAEETAKAGIDARMKTLSGSKRTISFFKEKLLSQVNEPAFQSIWLSQVRNHRAAPGEQLSPIVTSAYTGGLHLLLDNWFHYFNMIVFLFSTAGLIFLIFRRTLTPASLILPLGFTGGVIYHMLYEGKSQYILSYFVLLLPIAAYGIIESGKAIASLQKKLTKPKTEEAS